MKTCITQAPWLPRSKIKVVRSCGPSDRCWSISRKRNVVETPKLVERLPMPWAIKHQFQGQRQKAKVTRSTNTETGSASFLPNGRSYELEIWYTDELRRPVSPTSAMSTKVKGQGRDTTRFVWQVLAHKSRIQKVPETPKLVGSMPTPRAIKATSFKVKRSKIKVTRLTNAESGNAS